MKKFLKIFLMLIALFILPLGCGGGERDQFDYAADEEYHESSPDEWYEEPASTDLSDKEVKKLLKKYPDWRTNPQEFAEQAFVSEYSENMDNALVNNLTSYILRNATYANSIGMNADPAGITIGRVDQRDSVKSIDKEYLLIEKLQSIFALDPYEAEEYSLTKYFHKWKNENPSPYIIEKKKMGFYKVSLGKVKKNGKRDIVWSKIYPNFKARYLHEVETNHVWIDERLGKDSDYYFNFFKEDFNKILYNTVTQLYYEKCENFQKSLTEPYDTRIYATFADYSNAKRKEYTIDNFLEYHYYEDITPKEFLNNKNYVFKEDRLRGLITTWHGGVDEFVALQNKYKKYVIKSSEYIISENPDPTGNFYSTFIDEIFNLYLDYTYNKKLPPKK